LALSLAACGDSGRVGVRGDGGSPADSSGLSAGKGAFVGDQAFAVAEDPETPTDDPPASLDEFIPTVTLPPAPTEPEAADALDFGGWNPIQPTIVGATFQ
jgi:hypothetical protein